MSMMALCVRLNCLQRVVKRKSNKGIRALGVEDEDEGDEEATGIELGVTRNPVKKES